MGSNLLQSGFSFGGLLDVLEGQTQNRQEAPTGFRGQIATSEEGVTTLAFLMPRK